MLSTPLTPENATELQELIKAPYVRVARSALGGEKYASLYISISFDARETWSNGIFQNSRYAAFVVDYDGKVYKHNGWKTEKFRKSNFKSIADAAEKIQKWIDSHESS